jgi:hypothetical protein
VGVWFVNGHVVWSSSKNNKRRRDMGKVMICNLCNGEMKEYTGRRYGMKAAVVFIVLGLLACLFWVGPVLGLPLALIGIYMAASKREMWICQDCAAAYEKVDVKKQTIEK